MRIGEQIRQAREARGLSQEALAKAIGISQPAIRKIESGETERSRYLTEIAAYLGVSLPTHSPKHTVSTPLEATKLPYVTIDMPDRIAASPDVPLYGTARGGPGGDFVYEGGIVDYVRRLPGIANAKDVFALRVVGDSMIPALREGALIILDPRRPARVGDDVVIEFEPNEAGEHVQGCVKRLVKFSGAKLIVEQFNPAQQLTFDMNAVKAVHRVLTTDELMGI